MALPYLAQRANFPQMQICLALALADILANASADGATDICLVLPAGTARSSKPLQPQQCVKLTIPAEATRSAADTLQLLHAVIKQHASAFDRPDCQGVILLVYSVILSRGVERIRSDMDMAGCTLINEHGYASQEMVNLMLVGEAKSNVHDGDRDLGDDFVLKGIERQADVGFLTLYEHYGYFEVGKFLKQPRVPVWIVCSESHYSVAFSVDGSILKPQGQSSIDLVYYDELAKQEHDIILTLELGKFSEADRRATEKAGKAIVPLEAVIRTMWSSAVVNWNGRTKIL